MGVFSYLSIKKPASLIWKAFSPSRDVGGGSQSLLSSPGEGHLDRTVSIKYVKIFDWGSVTGSSVLSANDLLLLTSDLGYNFIDVTISSP